MMNFCPHCGSSLVTGEAYGIPQQSCPECDFIAFEGPKLAAGILVVHNGKLLMNKRNIEPGKGKWGFPAGYINAQERAEDGALREFHEETGLIAGISGLIGVYSHPERNIILIAYHGQILGGTMVMDHETLAVDYFDTDDLPELAFEQNREIIQDWLRLR